MNVQDFIEETNLEKIKILAKHYGINAYGAYGFNILHHAVLSKNIEKIKLVIQLGVRLDDRTMFGKTALHLAETKPIVELLIKSGANPNLKDWDGLNKFGILLNSWDQWEQVPYEPPKTYDCSRNEVSIRERIEKINKLVKIKLAELNYVYSETSQ